MVAENSDCARLDRRRTLCGRDQDAEATSLVAVFKVQGDFRNRRRGLWGGSL
jgi:hypothetical protein